MKPPFILSDDGDLTLFDSIEDLERYVESPDICAYKVFDAEGLVIHLVAKNHDSAKKRMIDFAATGGVAASKSDVIDIKTLETLVRNFIYRVTGESNSGIALADLIGILRRLGN